MKKVLIIVTVTLLVLVGTIAVLPFIFKDKIIQLVKDETNKNLNAKVDWGSFDLTILKTFPNFTFTLNNLQIIGINDFKNDTLIALKSLELKMDLMSVIKGDNIKINGIVLDNPRINAIVLKDGKANWDITKPSTDTTNQTSEPTKFKVALKRFAIINGYLVYNDKQSDIYTKLVGLNHELKGDFTQDIFDLITETTIDQLTFGYGGINYFNKVKTAVKANLTADMPNFKFTFKDNEFSLNALVFGLDGYFAMPKQDMDMDLKFNARKADFKEFLSLVPGTYTKDFEQVKTSGKLAFDGYVKGIYNDKKMPAFGLKLLVENAMFKYPSLPKSVNNINIDLNINNKTGNPDNTAIVLKKFHVEMGDNPLDMKMVITTPVSDATVDGWVKGKLNLASVKDFVPMEGTELNGVFTADVTLNGKMSSIDKGKYDEFKASGELKIENLSYKTSDLAYVTQIQTATMSFTPQYMDLSQFMAKVGKSDISFTGKVDNYMAYVFKDELLHGRFNFQSNYLDLNELMGPEEPVSNQQTAPDTAPLTVIEVPSNLDVELNSDIKKIDYDKLTLYNTVGLIKIKDSRMDLSNLKTMVFDGTVAMTGYYDTKKPKQPDVDMKLDIQGFDIQKTFAYFNSVQKLVPAAKYAKGKFNTIFNLTTKLNDKMEPDYNTINAYGKLQTINVVLSNHPSLSKIADQLKQPQYKNFALNNVDISFKIKDGKVEVEPFDVKLGNSNLTINGINYLDQRINYKMAFDIPRAELGSAANTVLNNLTAQAASKGINATVGERLKVNALITGTTTNPQIQLDLKDQAQNVMNDLKDKAINKAKEEADRLKAEAEAKARAEIEKAKAEAEAKAKEEADRLKAEAEAKKKEMEEKAKAEAEKAKKEAEAKAKAEAEKKLKGLFGK
jgi:hypothetical protein